MNKKYILILIVFVLCLACGGNSNDEDIHIPEEDTEEPEVPVEEPETPAISEEELLTLVQEETFAYFWDYAEVNSGAARERYLPNEPERDQHVVTTGGTGFGLMALLVGIERGFISRAEGVERISSILTFLEEADRFHGAWPHWLNGSTGAVIPFSEKDDGGDLVETAFLVQGLICIKEYFNGSSATEQQLANLADELWKGVEFNWYTNNTEVLYWHWSPNYNFDMNLSLKGYNEVLVTYVLAAASNNFSIDKEVYNNGWASNGDIVSSKITYGLPLVVKHAGAEDYGGPLFWAHYSFLGLNPNGLVDAYANYENVVVNHTKINYQYCVENPKNYQDYGANCWGLTASYTMGTDGGLGYSAHSPTNDRGVISPTAAISSIPYTPEESMAAMYYFYQHRSDVLGPAGFYDAFSPSYNWVAPAYLAIDQGPQIIMIENYRTGLLWRLFMQNEEVQAGLNKLGFSYEM